MSWGIDYESLNDIVKLQGNVITATYADKPLEGASDRTYLVCQALGAARRGEVINLSQDNQLCVAGDYWCGFALEPHPAHHEFTVDVRHGYCSYTVAKMARRRGPPLPYNLSKYIILAPIEKTTWDPDLVIFTCLPVHAHNLVAASTYDSGEVKESIVSASLCRSALSYPLVTNDIQIGLIDNGGRRWGKYKLEELIVSMPARWFYTILRNHREIKKFPPKDPSVSLATVLTDTPGLVESSSIYHEAKGDEKPWSWQIDYSSLGDLLKLEGNVVTATYRDEPLPGGYVKAMRLCTALGAARKGKIINLDGPHQTCVGGLYWCGFHSEPYPGMIDFQVEKNHRFVNKIVAERDIILPRKIPFTPARYLVFAPLEKTPFEPDLVIFTCHASQAHDLVSTYGYDSGDTKSSIITGAVCRSSITYPLTRSELNIGLIDNGGRRHAGFKPEEMVVSMPTRVFLNILRNHKAKRGFGPPEPHGDFLLLKKTKKETKEFSAVPD